MTNLFSGFFEKTVEITFNRKDRLNKCILYRRYIKYCVDNTCKTQPQKLFNQEAKRILGEATISYKFCRIK